MAFAPTTRGQESKPVSGTFESKQAPIKMCRSNDPCTCFEPSTVTSSLLQAKFIGIGSYLQSNRSHLRQGQMKVFMRSS